MREPNPDLDAAIADAERRFKDALASAPWWSKSWIVIGCALAAGWWLLQPH